jgi:hypothetical protein
MFVIALRTSSGGGVATLGMITSTAIPVDGPAHATMSTQMCESAGSLLKPIIGVR